MKIEQTHHRSQTLSNTLNEDFTSGSNFKQKLPKYLKQIDIRTKILQSEKTASIHSSPLSRQVKFSTQKNKLSSDISTLLQTSNKMYYFMGRNPVDNYSEIAIYEYMKADGKLDHIELTGIKGVMMAMLAGFCAKRKLPVRKVADPPKPAKRSQSIKNMQENIYEIVLLLGNKNGNLKTIRFAEPESTIETNPSIQNLKLDHTPIIDIFILNSQHYSNANVCLALSMTNRVYLVNFDHMSLLAQFVPTIFGCEVGLSLAVNCERHYFLQACESGYIIFWDIDEKVRQLIKHSCCQLAQNENSSQNKPSFIKKESEQNNRPQLKPPKFRPSDIHYCISPISIFHSSTITGIKFCNLYGNLLLIITQGGLIRLLAVNKSSYAHINENEFCVLLEHQVQDGELISDVKFFPETRDIFLVKNAGLEGVIEKSGNERFVHVKEYALNSTSKKKEKVNEYNNNINFPFKPTFIRQIKRSLYFPQRQRSKSVGNKAASPKCYFERISFNTQLEIDRVDKVYPNHIMEYIESVDLVAQRDLVFLRGKDFYLVGQTDLFKVFDLE